jgi:hypothetical protein
MDRGYRVHLANPSAIKQYEGLKHTDDRHDSFWLAHMLALGILPEGYIYLSQRGSSGSRSFTQALFSGQASHRSHIESAVNARAREGL